MFLSHIQPAVGCYDSWANLRCSGCSPLGENCCETGMEAIPTHTRWQRLSDRYWLNNNPTLQHRIDVQSLSIRGSLLFGITVLTHYIRTYLEESTNFELYCIVLWFSVGRFFQILQQGLIRLIQYHLRNTQTKQTVESRSVSFEIRLFNSVGVEMTLKDFHR